MAEVNGFQIWAHQHCCALSMFLFVQFESPYHTDQVSRQSLTVTLNALRSHASALTRQTTFHVPTLSDFPNFSGTSLEKDKGSRPTHVLPDLSVTKECGCPSLLDGARGLFLRGEVPSGSNTVTAGWLSQKWERNDNLAVLRRGRDPLRVRRDPRFPPVMRLFVTLKTVWVSSLVLCVNVA